MTWVSYAQNAEDVRLRRAFTGQPTGFYIDVGANNPIQFSVTKHFYEQGWTGINVEPSPGPFAMIVKDRGRDINLNVACSSAPGSRTFYAARGEASGLSSFTKQDVEQHERNGFKFDAITTEVTTLAAICEQHAGQRTIDFLSIDVEGHEREVLEGADFERFRPRVIVIEATLPNSMQPKHEEWEPIVLRNRYEFAVFDGLNRYYVRSEDAQLAPLIALGPNLFDDYIAYEHHRRIEALEKEIAALRTANKMVGAIARVLRGGTTLARGGLERLRRGRA